jgi:hypothetical protein
MAPTRRRGVRVGLPANGPVREHAGEETFEGPIFRSRVSLVRPGSRAATPLADPARRRFTLALGAPGDPEGCSH